MLAPPLAACLLAFVTRSDGETSGPELLEHTFALLERRQG